VAILFSLACAIGWAQRYDVAAEVTLKGVVDEVKQHAHQGVARQGVHVSLKTADAIYDIHLGPAAFVRRISLTLAKGDEIEVTGSKVPYQGAAAILARQVTKGGQSYELRNKEGLPLWPAGRPKRS
jgi:hypothetical protein